MPHFREDREIVGRCLFPVILTQDQQTSGLIPINQGISEIGIQAPGPAFLVWGHSDDRTLTPLEMMLSVGGMISEMAKSSDLEMTQISPETYKWKDFESQMIRGVFNHDSDDFQNWALNSPGWWWVSLFKYGLINFYRKSSSLFWWGHSSALAVLLHRILWISSCWRQWRDAQIGVAWSGIPRSDFTIVPIPPKRNPGLLDPWIRAHVWRYRIWSGNEIGANAALVASRMLCLSPGSGRSFLHVEKGGVPVNKSLTINIRWWSNENHTIHRGGANW